MDLYSYISEAVSGTLKLEGILNKS